MGTMELTVEVHHEDDSYWAEVTRSELAELQGSLTEARTLTELADYLEDLVRICLADETVQLVAPDLAVGTVQVTATRAGPFV